MPRELANDLAARKESEAIAENLIAGGLDTVIENEWSSLGDSTQKRWK